MASDWELVHLAFNRVKELSLIYGDSIPHFISVFNEPGPEGSRASLLNDEFNNHWHIQHVVLETLAYEL
jgi:hypothetical protein